MRLVFRLRVHKTLNCNGVFFVNDVQVRIETDPADRTQLRMTVASGDPTLTFEYVTD